MDNCGDNRFEIIETAKQDLLNSTNIDSSKDEMKVLDNFLFRCWQMGWLNQYNLTSDAEGEEILTCEKSKAMQLYSHLLDLVENERIIEHYSEWCGLEREYIALFGENVFADYFGSKCLPDELNEDNFAKSEPKPSEPKENANKYFDNILKGSFNEHNRLHIAAMIMSGLLASGKEKHHPVRRALDLADALIAECEKGETI